MDSAKRPELTDHVGLSDRWVGAGDLKVGDQLKQADGTIGTVTGVQTITQSKQMYNLSVGVAHTYFVGQMGWLVHNNDHIVIVWRGVNDELINAADKLGARHLLDAPDWYDQIIEAAKNSDTKVSVLVDGWGDDIEGSVESMVDKVKSEYGKTGIAPHPEDYYGSYSHTDWEMYIMDRYKGLEKLDFVETLEDGYLDSIDNPFCE